MALELKANKREDSRKSTLNQIRKQGGVVGVIYGKEYGNENVSVNRMELMKLLRDNGRNSVFKLDIDGEKTDVMVHEYQMDTIKNEMIHVDFFAINMKEELDADVAVVTVGEAAGVKNGGIVQQALFEVSVRALPNDIPEMIEVDITDLEINDTLQVKDLKTEASFTINNDPEEAVLSILPPMEEEEETTDAEVTEPEVIGEKEEE